MYNVQPLTLTPPQIETLVALAATVDLAPGPGGSRITPVPLAPILACCRALPFPALAAAAFIVLYPSAQLVAHVDPPLPGGTRLHVPLVVNPGCWSFSAGAWQQLAVGQVYAMDPTVLHGAVNWGATTRLHLMLDLASGVI